MYGYYFAYRPTAEQWRRCQDLLKRRVSNDNLPIVVAGHGGGAFEPGRHVDLGENVPLTNLYMRMLNEFGVDEKRFGDSTGALKKV